eukprot:11849774-Heterocapsa_arctica.AAC.1
MVEDETIVSQLSEGERIWKSDERLTPGFMAGRRRGTRNTCASQANARAYSALLGDVSLTSADLCARCYSK